MEIKGLAKTTLLDYPGHVAATIFTGGCDFKCPFCHNKSLVMYPNRLPSIPMDEIYDFLERRKSALEGICITGGEPLLQEDLCEFLYNVKMMGYKVKIDTNGYDPTHLSHILKNNLADYIAMDIKNSQENYAKTAGISNLDLTRIKLSVDLLKDSEIEYESAPPLPKNCTSGKISKPSASGCAGPEPITFSLMLKVMMLLCQFFPATARRKCWK